MNKEIRRLLAFSLGLPFCGAVASAAIYVSDSPLAGSGKVKRIAGDGSVAAFVSGAAPQGIATWGGSLFVADSGLQGLFKYAATDTAPASGASVAGGLLSPGSVAADASTGSLFVTNGPHQIIRLTSGGDLGAFAFMRDAVHAMTVDRGGNLFVGETATVEDEEGNFVDVGRISRLTSQGVPSTFYQSDSLAPFLKSPGAMAFDAAGSLFVSERDGGRIDHFGPGGEASVFYTVPSGHEVTGLTFDSNGVLYASLAVEGKIIAFAPGAGAPTDFATTGLQSPGALTADPPLVLPEPSRLAPLVLATGFLICRRRVARRENS